MELWRVMAGEVLYATRPTREEADKVIKEQGHLARKFGLPVVAERAVIPLRPANGVRSRRG